MNDSKDELIVWWCGADRAGVLGAIHRANRRADGLATKVLAH